MVLFILLTLLGVIALSGLITLGLLAVQLNKARAEFLRIHRLTR